MALRVHGSSPLRERLRLGGHVDGREPAGTTDLGQIRGQDLQNCVGRSAFRPAKEAEARIPSPFVLLGNRRMLGWP